MSAVGSRELTGAHVVTASGWGVLTAASTWLMLRESTPELQIRALKADPLWQTVSLAATPVPGGFRLALRTRF
jgi:hypothetical protein